MTEYKWKTTIEGTIRIVDTPTREPPSLNNDLGTIVYNISADEVEIELHRHRVFHGDSDGHNSFHQGSLFGKYSRKGVYILRSYNRYISKDIEITGEELRENMKSLIRETKECWVSGDHCPMHLDHSRNFWANGDLQLLELILEKENYLPMSVRNMLTDLAGVRLGE
ncbi:hypothetical protein HYX11_01675 [Candidatus Woesearchaeota archaeon]|nr:hypothetical protein [Candidatus Woesearchaeota archaeon]